MFSDRPNAVDFREIARAARTGCFRCPRARLDQISSRVQLVVPVACFYLSYSIEQHPCVHKWLGLGCSRKDGCQHESNGCFWWKYLV